jgi:ATP-dependent Clp protease ATP-binding subunit ClpA
VADHIKRMLSGAFLSRVGTPIVFDPLDGAALALIVERAVKAAVVSAAAHLHAGIAGVVLEEGLGARAVALLESRLVSSGARALLEQGRSLASNAILELQQCTPDISNRVLRVFFDAEGRLRIKPE